MVSFVELMGWMLKQTRHMFDCNGTRASTGGEVPTRKPFHSRIFVGSKPECALVESPDPSYQAKYPEKQVSGLYSNDH